MKILLFWAYYKPYLQSFYQQNPRASTLPYAEQMQLLLSDAFGWPMALPKYWRAAGHQAEIVISNAEHLQRAWAQENGVPFDEQTWEREIVRAQIQHYRPDVLWIGSLFSYFGAFMTEIAPYCRRIFAWISCPLPETLSLKGIDVILTSYPESIMPRPLKEKKTYYVLPAFDPEILQRLEPRSPAIDFSFIGGLHPQKHATRVQWLDTLARRTSIQIWGYGLLPHRRRWFFQSPLARRYQGEAWGMEMYRLLYQSKLAFNCHIDVALGLAGNMRMFEATGVGSLLITEASPNLSDLFEPNREVVTYASETELLDKVAYYLHHDDEREDIARAGQTKTLASYNASTRSEELLAIFEEWV